MQKLGMVEYRKLMEEVDQMTNEPVDVMALVNKRIEELREHLEAEEKEKQEGERRQTQSKTDKAGASSMTTMTNEPTQEPRKRTCGVDDIDEFRIRNGAKKQNHQRVPRRKKCEKLQGQRSQSLKLTTSTNLEVELVPRNQNHQRVLRRKKSEKLQGQRSQSLNLTTLSTNWKIEKKEQAQKKLPSLKVKEAAQAKKAKKTVLEDDPSNSRKSV